LVEAIFVVWATAGERSVRDAHAEGSRAWSGWAPSTTATGSWPGSPSSTGGGSGPG